MTSEGSGTPSAGGGGEEDSGDGGSGGFGQSVGGGATEAGGSGTGGAEDGPSKAPCEVWAEKFDACAPKESTCPFAQSLSACESYCLAEVNCNFYDPDETEPAGRWGYGVCFESCATGFYCPSDERILPAYRICDGISDCTSGEDEEDGSCGMGSSGFLCDGKRIPRRDVCNGSEDCGDGSDESTCPGFLCHDGLSVVPIAALCDHVAAECADESDEFDCPER